VHDKKKNSFFLPITHAPLNLAVEKKGFMKTRLRNITIMLLELAKGNRAMRNRSVSNILEPYKVPKGTCSGPSS
jgi:hypothetical protein